jgi:non-heme chloroperoxidase
MSFAVHGYKRRTVLILLITLIVLLYAQPLPAWKDPSPHNTRFVPVEKGVRLEVLDWGGTGRPLVLLAGGGDTAHVFDDFAPKLTSSFHVYGITRRGFGESGFSPKGYGADRLGDDVLAVLDALNLKRPILVGHSLGGEELSSLATRYPSRVTALVYLEAAYPYAFDNGKGPTWKEFEDAQKLRPRAPPLSESSPGLASFAALQQAIKRALGLTYPEAELRQQFTATPDGRVGRRRDFPGEAVMLQGMKKYANIPVPALAIFAVPHAQPPWMTDSADPKVREAAKAFWAVEDALTRRQAKAFEDGVPTAHVVRLRGADHYVYLSNEADVLREMESFFSTLRLTREPSLQMSGKRENRAQAALNKTRSEERRLPRQTQREATSSDISATVERRRSGSAVHDEAGGLHHQHLFAASEGNAAQVYLQELFRRCSDSRCAQGGQYHAAQVSMLRRGKTAERCGAQSENAPRAPPVPFLA